MKYAFDFTAPPIIIVSPPPTINVEIDHTFIINCTALGVPTPEIVWRLNWGHVPDKCTMTSTPQGADNLYIFCLHFCQLFIYLFLFYSLFNKVGIKPMEKLNVLMPKNLTKELIPVKLSTLKVFVYINAYHIVGQKS